MSVKKLYSILNTIKELGKEFDDILETYLKEQFSEVIDLLKSIEFKKDNNTYGDVLAYTRIIDEYHHSFRISHHDLKLHITMTCYDSKFTNELIECFVYKPHLEDYLFETIESLKKNILDEYAIFFRRDKLKRILK